MIAELEFGWQLREPAFLLLMLLAVLVAWLRHRGRAGLCVCDWGILEPRFTRLARDAELVGQLASDLAMQFVRIHTGLFTPSVLAVCAVAGFPNDHSRTYSSL